MPKASIKMRYNRDRESVCCGCSEKGDEVLEMYDICVGKTIFTICDVCNEALNMKSLKAIVELNGRVKQQRDMAILRRRAHGSYAAKHRYEKELEKRKENFE